MTHVLDQIEALKQDYFKKHGKPATYLIVDNVTIWDIVKHNIDAQSAKKRSEFPKVPARVDGASDLLLCSRTFAGLQVKSIVAEKTLLVTDRAGWREIEDKYDPE